jgi:hypothetical protein
MEKFTTPYSTFMARMQHPGWQQQLQQSVRLYLELGADPSLLQEYDELLQRTEAELLDFLLAGVPPTAAQRRQAQDLLDQAQHALLASAQQQGPRAPDTEM